MISTLKHPLIRFMSITFCSMLMLIFFEEKLLAADDLHEGDHENEQVELSTALAEELGIQTQIAGPGIISRSLLLYGKTMPDPQQVSHVAARYPGMIRSIQPNLGDVVEAGQTIAVIEANTSLQLYEIEAPISGIVIEKHANPGELANEEPLLTIANYDNMWVDLTVFPSDARQVKPNLPVTISIDDLLALSTVRYLNPTEGNAPILIARVPLANPELIWTPGLLVEGRVQIEQINANLVIDNNAIQTFEGQSVVFTVQGDIYSPRPLMLGASDNRFTEVVSGLSAGEIYVVENSYLLKADLEKDGATHSH